MTKQIAVIGLGRFGVSVAHELYQLGHDVLVIDRDERLTQSMMGHVTYTVTADGTSIEALEELGIRNFDAAVVAVGTDVQSSILATVLLKRTFEIPEVVARANNDLHGKTLEAVGADRVVYPEQESGIRVAHSLFQREVLEYMELTPKFGFSKIRPPATVVGKTLEEAGLGGLRDKYGVAVVAIRRDREPILAPSKDEIIQPDDLLIIAGREDMLEKIQVS